MDAVPRPGRVAEAVLLGALGILLAWVVLFGGGSHDRTLATAGTTIGRIGITRRNPSRGGSEWAAHASAVPTTSAIASDPRPSSTVHLTVVHQPGRV